MFQVSSIQYRKLDYEEFCAAAISVHQLEGMETWEQHARRAYELFEKDGNRPIMIEELASVLLLCSANLYIIQICLNPFEFYVHGSFYDILDLYKYNNFISIYL